MGNANSEVLSNDRSLQEHFWISCYTRHRWKTTERDVDVSDDCIDRKELSVPTRPNGHRQAGLASECESVVSCVKRWKLLVCEIQGNVIETLSNLRIGGAHLNLILLRVSDWGSDTIET